MNIITSSYSPKEHLNAIKENMGGHFTFGAERFTGFFLGRWFHVTHHAGYEWNRRYTNQKNAAVGYVKETESGCEVRFVCLKGALVPAQFLLYLCLLPVITLAMMLSDGLTGLALFKTLLLIEIGILAVFAPLFTLFESMTERSEEGKRILLAMLLDPKDPFSYLNNRNKLP